MVSVPTPVWNPLPTFLPMSVLITSYLFLGIIVVFARPQLRSLITAPLRSSFNRGEAVLTFCILLIVGIPLWPIIWLNNIRAVSSEKKTLDEIKTHLTQKGRNIRDSDSVLLTQHRFILNRLDEVSKEWGERLPKAVTKDVSFYYMNLWAELDESNLGGMGFFLLLRDGMETYRAGGIPALLQLLREGSSISENKLQEAQAALYERLKAFGKLNASVRYSGGDGLSFDDAIIIVGADILSGVRAEYDYIEQRYPGYQFHQQSLKEYKGRTFDVLEFTTAAGEKKAMYFDISACYPAEP